MCIGKGARRDRTAQKPSGKCGTHARNLPMRLDEELSPRSSKTIEKVQSMFGKFALGNMQKSKKYRYSQELREETRRGSRICINDIITESSNISAMSLMSLVDAESRILRPSSVVSRDLTGDSFTSQPELLLFDGSEVEVRPGYEG